MLPNGVRNSSGGREKVGPKSGICGATGEKEPPKREFLAGQAGAVLVRSDVGMDKDLVSQGQNEAQEEDRGAGEGFRGEKRPHHRCGGGPVVWHYPWLGGRTCPKEPKSRQSLAQKDGQVLDGYPR